MQTNVVFEHFSHETVDAAAHVCQEHENVRAVIIIGEGALNRIGAATARRVAELGASQRVRDGVRLLVDGIICSFAANQN